MADLPVLHCFAAFGIWMARLGLLVASAVLAAWLVVAVQWAALEVVARPVVLAEAVQLARLFAPALMPEEALPERLLRHRQRTRLRPLPSSA